MRRAIIQNLRTFRRPTPRNALKKIFHQRSIANRSPQQQLQSSMRFARRVSTPIAIAGVAAAGYYVYNQRSVHAEAPSDAVPSVSSFTSGGSKGYQTAAGASSYATPAHHSLDAIPPTEVPEAVRKALIVDQGQLYTAPIPAGETISKDTDFSGKKVLEMLTPEQATAKLRRNEESYLVGRGEGVVRYDVVQIPSNDPIEDDHVEKIVEVPNTIAAAEDGKARSDWMFWGVFDGHAGWTTSAKLRQTLVSYVARELNATYKSALADPALNFPTSDSVDAAIKKGFLKLDNEITHDSVQKVLKAQSKPLAAELLAPALSGSCALLSFYDSRSKLLRVACTGDSRAVLGRRSATAPSTWTATALSIDQTGGTESEAARLRQEHPGEPSVTMNGRILGGLEPSRAFGDATYKWSMEIQQKLYRNFFARSPNKNCKTPPYVTAEPIITTTQVDPTKGDFVVMATDGLWEMLSNEEVVGLVGQWLEKQGSGLSTAPVAKTSAGSWLQSWFSSQPAAKAGALPIEHSSGSDSTGQRAPIRQQQWGLPSGQDSRFVVEDKNAATHLVRNALGGKDKDMVSALLTLPAPFSRRYRDDLTVQVIFFGEQSGQEPDRSVRLNEEASATVREGNGKVPGELKAKL